MIVSIETPVFKGRRLKRCIDSVLAQSVPNWRLSLLWDGGDDESRNILFDLDRQGHPQITVYFAENRGIARARRYLSEHSDGDFILPLDDDDALPFHAVERFLAAAEQKPWASVIRARRAIIDDEGAVTDEKPWFPFERRHYRHGMVTDIFNHTQPYLIRRSAYNRTTGWEGFDDFRQAGEDCDIYLKLEETGSIELLDEELYYYRLHDQRASLFLTDKGAYEMWRRLTDKTIARIGLSLRRTNEKPPFHYERLARPRPSLGAADVVVVRDERTSRFALQRIKASLQGASIADDQVRIVTRAAAAHLGEAFRGTSRPFVVLVDANVDVDPAGLESLVKRMGESDTDLAAPKLVNRDGFIVCAAPGFSGSNVPTTGEGEWDKGQQDRSSLVPWLSEKLLVIRREVINAVGGVDEGYEHDRTAMVDFCLRARQRDFRCAYFGGVRFIAGRTALPNLESDLERLNRKWTDYPDLFHSALIEPLAYSG
jgi:glycosyltransferase involved in cell wall biosynthesis